MDNWASKCFSLFLSIFLFDLLYNNIIDRRICLAVYALQGHVFWQASNILSTVYICTWPGQAFNQKCVQFLMHSSWYCANTGIIIFFFTFGISFFISLLLSMPSLRTKRVVQYHVCACFVCSSISSLMWFNGFSISQHMCCRKCISAEKCFS